MNARSTLAVAWIAAVVVVALTWHRLFFGADFGDESAYAVLPARFLLGDRPFVDEVNLIQTTGFFTLPLVGAWKLATGSLDGVVLFLRIAYFAATAALTWFAARTLAWSLPRPASFASALVIALPVAAFVPLGLPTFSYNTLASGFFLLGLALLFRARTRASMRTWFLAGLAHGFASFAIPTYVLAALLAFGCAAWSARGTSVVRERRAFVSYAAGGVLAVAMFAPLLVHVDRETFAFGYAYTGGSGAWLEKLRVVAWQSWRVVPHKPFVIGALLVFLGAARFGRKSAACVVLTVLVVGLVPSRGPMDSSVLAGLIAVLGAFVAPFAWRAPGVKAVFAVFWVPSIAAGILAAWTSGNGIANVGLGALPAALATMFFVVTWTSSTPAPSPEIAASTGAASALASNEVSPLARDEAVALARSELAPIAFAWLAPLAFVAAFLACQRESYLEGPIAALDTRIADGPLRGLHTSSAKAAWLERTCDAIRAAAPGHERIYAVLHFPLAYLLTDLRPAARSVWGLACPPTPDCDCDARFTADLAHFAERDVLVVELRHLVYSASSTIDQPDGRVARAVRDRFDVLRELDGATLFVPRPR